MYGGIIKCKVRTRFWFNVGNLAIILEKINKFLRLQN